MAQVAGQNPSRLLYVWDRKAGNKFLVDTGAQVSVFPSSSHDRRREKTEPLVAANAPGLTPLGRDAYRLTWDFVSSTGILFLLIYIALC